MLGQAWVLLVLLFASLGRGGAALWRVLSWPVRVGRRLHMERKARECDLIADEFEGLGSRPGAQRLREEAAEWRRRAGEL